MARDNRFSLCNVQVGLFPTGNERATTSTAQQSRSESAIAVNPNNPANMVGASKKFIDPSIYLFRLGPIYTFDGGNTWHESTLPMQSGWDGMTDPTVAFDDFGNCFLVGEPLRFNQAQAHTGGDITGLGMVVYRSSDGGKTWGSPTTLTTTTSDDKQWVICDNNPASPHYGNVYVAWAAWGPLRFARSLDHGATWQGKGQAPPGSSLVSFAFAPDLSVSADGTLHILWHNDASDSVLYLRSTDGGNTFDPLRTVVQGLVSLRGHLPITDGWPHFDDGRFRVMTLVTSCCSGGGGGVIVAWADMREGRSRIYYRRSLDHGVTWQGPASGKPLLPLVTYGDAHCFHPQIVTTGTDVIGCAFYVFGKEQADDVIKVQLAGSWDEGATFSQFVTVTDRSWDPLINAPAVHGDPNVDFIGEYFGLDAGEEDFALLWTDTRTGVQELFSDVVRTKKVTCHHIPELVSEILFGVAEDGGGVIIVNGKVVRIPPRSPELRALEKLAELGAEVEETERAAAAEAIVQALAEDIGPEDIGPRGNA